MRKRGVCNLLRSTNSSETPFGGFRGASWRIRRVSQAEQYESEKLGLGQLYASATA